MNEATVRLVDDGPLEITGTATVVDADGRPFAADEGPLYLCRCGGSQNKPFCDGTHAKLGFEARNRAEGRVEGSDLS